MIINERHNQIGQNYHMGEALPKQAVRYLPKQYIAKDS